LKLFRIHLFQTMSTTAAIRKSQVLLQQLNLNSINEGDSIENVSTKIPSTPSKTLKNRRQKKAIITPSTSDISDKENTDPAVSGKKAPRKLPFGRGDASVKTISVPEDVKMLYKLVRKHTGSIGGNGSFGAIYGELTEGNMQKMVNLMKEHTNFDSNSKFIDVGSGIGKPNLHVAQDPGVEFSYGIEMERSRWMLSISCLKAVQNEDLGPKCYFEHGNIKKAKTFDPFSHVYMFSIGFPPTLWDHLSEMFNKSQSPYLICYQSPRIIVDRYAFEVELITQVPTHMHGSKECHTAYIYKRNQTSKKNKKIIRCDPLFQEAYNLVRGDKKTLHQKVEKIHQEEVYGGRVTRSKKIVHCVESDSEEE